MLDSIHPSGLHDVNPALRGMEGDSPFARSAEDVGFLFATGIENSAPTIQGGRIRRDQLAECGFYDRWREDFALVQETGCTALRYGPQLHTTLRGAGQYDWDFADQTFARLCTTGIRPIVDLCHFGVPDWLGDFQNPDFPAIFADYARAFAQRFPWVRMYTPVNEMFITAVFSAKYGWWNEQRQDDRSYVTAIRNVVMANVMAMRAILEVRPDALFIQSESTEQFHPECPDSIAHADHRNAERFLTLDLNYGRRVCSAMYEYLFDNGLTREDYRYFQRGAELLPNCVMGNDWYMTNEHVIGADGHSRWAGEVFGYDTVTRDYYARYRLPVMHTETNKDEGPEGNEAEHWLWKQWSGIMRLRGDGVPMLGFTWYSLTDQVDWSHALREVRGDINPRGLYDLDRKPRAVGRAYKRLIAQWRPVLKRQGHRLGMVG